MTDRRARPLASAGLLRDLAALAMIVGGTVGVCVAGFAVDWRLGVGLLSTIAIIAGVILGYER